MRRHANHLLILLAVSIAHTASAQTGRNTVLTGFTGVPWGASLESARTALGTPDSVGTRADTTDLTYRRRDFMGMPATMWVRATSGEGVISGGYYVQAPQCATFTRVGKEILAASPRLVPMIEPSLRSPTTRSTDPDSVCASGHFSGTQVFRDPEGPGKLTVLSTGTPEDFPPMVVMYFAVRHLNESPSAGDPPSERAGLIRAGVTAAPPAGFPLFRRYVSEQHFRGYVSRSGTRTIVIAVFDARDEAAPREGILDFVEGILHGAAVGQPLVETRDDATHLVRAARMEIERDGQRARAVSRFYVPLAGCPVGVGIRVDDTSGTADPADDPAIVAFLAAARPQARDCDAP